MTNCPSTGIEDCSSVFTRLEINRTLDGMTLIEWDLSSSFEFTSNPAFTVEWSLSGGYNSDDWEALDPQGFSSYFFLHDTPHWAYDQGPHYRTVMVADGQTYRSAPILWGTHFAEKRDWLQYREILRRACVDFIKGDGREGYLMKRKHWGVECPECLDWDTGQPTRHDCPICYGTTFVGGYHPILPEWMKLGPQERNIRNVETKGMWDLVIKDCMAMANPYKEARDVWIDFHSDKRYFIHPVKSIEQVRDVDVIVSVELRLADPTNVVYQVPMIQGSSSSSS